MTTTSSPSRMSIAALALCAAAILAMPAATPCAAGSADPAVKSADQPLHGDTEIDLVRQWSRGDESDDLFFGLISACAEDAAGNLYLLDSQLSEVVVLDVDGEYLRTIGREGEGPGEFRRAESLSWMPDGALGVVQRFPGSVVKLKADGTPAGTILPGDPVTGGRDMLQDAQSANGHLVFCGAHMTRTDNGRERRDFLSYYNTDGTERVELFGRTDVFDFSVNSFNEADQTFLSVGRWAVLDDGRVAAAPKRDAYRIEIFGPDGAVETIITRDAAPYRRTREQLERLDRRWKSSRRYERFGTEQIFSETEPMISQITARPDGELWVLPAKGRHEQPEGVLQTWDVMNAEGDWDRRVALKAPGDGVRDRVFLLGDDRVLVVSGYQDARDALDGQASEDDVDEEPEPMEVILYTIP